MVPLVPSSQVPASSPGDEDSSLPYHGGNVSPSQNLFFGALN